MSTSSRFSEFCENIKLTSAQYADAKTKYDNVCKTLHNYYYPSTFYNGSTKFLIGSYGKETAIRPPGDVDVIFKIPFHTYKRFSDNKTGPKGLLEEVKSILKNTFTTTDKIRANGMVVEVAFSTFDIEVLPAFEWTIEDYRGQYQIPEMSSASFAISKLLYPQYGLEPTSSALWGSWKRIDPKKEIEDLNTSNYIYAGNTKQLIKMMKMWLVNCNVPIKPVVIERIAIEFMSTFEYNTSRSIFYDYMIRDFLLFLKNKKNTTIFMPGINEDIKIGEDWFSKAETAYSRAVKACEYESMIKEFDAANEWKKIFGNDYPY